MRQSTQALEIESVPARLVVVGGGVIGLELACIFEALGSKVTVLEMAPAVLAGATDEVIAQRLSLLLRRRGIAIETGKAVRRITQSGEFLSVHTTGPDGESVVEGDRVLLATGRWPNTASLDLEAVGVEMRGRAIWADEWMATSVPNVWAIGDAVGGWMLAHKAMVDGRVAAENATGGERAVDYRSVASVVFTRPELASVGLTDRQAREAGTEVKVSQFPFSANPRAQILRETDGVVRSSVRPAAGAFSAFTSSVRGRATSSRKARSRCSSVATGRVYGAEGLWFLQEGGRVRLCFTDFMQQHSGDAAFVSVKPAGTRLQAGDEFAELETVKVNLGVQVPIGGTIVEVNAALELTPEVVNEDPYGKGWLAVIEPASWEGDRAKLLDASAYLEVVRSRVEQELKGQ